MVLPPPVSAVAHQDDAWELTGKKGSLSGRVKKKQGVSILFKVKNGYIGWS